MHELSVADSVLDAAIRRAGGQSVIRVTLHVGTLRRVVPDRLAMYWGMLTPGTSCEDSKLEQVRVPARLHCEHCHAEWETDSPRPVMRCRECASAAVMVVAGEELEITSVETADTLARIP